MSQNFILFNRMFAFLLVGCLFCTVGIGQEEKKEEDKANKDESKKIATVDLKLSPISVYETVDGIFESTNTSEVETDFENWKDLKISEVISEGQKVTKGQIVVALDTESMEKAVKEAEFGLKNLEFALRAAELEMKEVEATLVLDGALADRTWNNAQQDAEYFQNVELPQRIKDLDFSEKTAGYFLEYSQDELDQLEQMYTEDELTEESEEIVLKRARRSVESAGRGKDRTMQRVKRDRDFTVPRDVKSREDSLKRAELTYQKSQVTLPIKKEKAELALAQAKFNYDKKKETLEDLYSDQKKMNVLSPMNGVLYYGKCVRGKWVGGTGAPKRRLEKDKKVTAKTVIMTVVDLNQMMVRANLDESKLGALQQGMQGTAMVKTAGKQKMPVSVKSVGKIPMDDGKYDCQIEIGGMNGDALVMPGMGCKLSFLVHESAESLVAPKASVFSDDGGITHYVYVVDGMDSEKRMVRVGHTSGDQIEIVDGVTVNDKIAKTKPK